MIKRYSYLRVLVGMILFISLSCSWWQTAPAAPQTDSTELIPSAVVDMIPENPPLPPALVEIIPLPRSEVGINDTITLFFSEAMDRSTVENALRFSPFIDVSLTWVNDSCLEVLLNSMPPAGETFTLTIAASAQTLSGVPLQQEISLQYAAPGSLVMLDSQPEANSSDVNPSSAIFISFNRPVVELSAEGALQEPNAFTLSPSAEGRGYWLNTSTYIFFPDPPLLGGTTYTIDLNTSLTSLAGGELTLQEGQSASWNFTTALPRLVSSEPPEDETIPLDAEFVLNFNQPMDVESVEASLSLVDTSGAAVDGTFSWSENLSSVTFQPNELLQRGGIYTLTLTAPVAAAGGSLMSEPFSAQFTTVSSLAVDEIEPSITPELVLFGGGYGMLNLSFTAHLEEQDFEELITFTPEIADAYIYLSNDRTVTVSGYFNPSTIYQLTISNQLADRWGGAMSEPYRLTFATSQAQPTLTIPALHYGSQAMFLTPEDAYFTVQATNLARVDIQASDLTLDEFIDLAEVDWTSPVPQMTADRSWTQPLTLSPNYNTPVQIGLKPGGGTLEPGLYRYYLQSSELNQEGDYAPEPFLAVVSNIQISMKRSGSQLFIWTVDLRENVPFADAVVNIYDGDFNLLGSIQTSADGTGQMELPQDLDVYARLFAVIGQPGKEDFSLAMDGWNAGVSGSDFGYYPSYTDPQTMAYLYTDRPIYQPGQEVFFRVVVRQQDNARYSLADLSQVTLDVYTDYSMETGQQPLLTTQVIPLSAYGTGHGSFVIPEDASPGYYSMNIQEIDSAFLNFKVAEYRKPEIDLQTQFEQSDYVAGEDFQVLMTASYFFGAPAGNLPVHWALYAKPSWFSLPYGYQTGIQDMIWAEEYLFPEFNPLGTYVAGGDGETLPDGSLQLTIPFDSLDLLQNMSEIRELTLEVTIQDSSQMPVSARATAVLHPSEVYIGVRADAWSVQAGDSIGFFVQTVNWEKAPAPGCALVASFEKVTWETQPASYPGGFPEFVPVYTPKSSATFETDANGQAYLLFTPEEPGTYVLRMTGEGAETRLLVWVGGAGSASWPLLPQNHISLTVDAAEYLPGQEATIFVPNPFPGETLALLTIERSEVMYADVMTIEGSNAEISIPIEEIFAPNVYASVTLLSQDETGNVSFRQGYVELTVSSATEQLQVTLTPSQDVLSPGEQMQFDVQVKDAEGDPVQGEFSLSLVDKAIFALFEPNVPGIVDAFYGRQSLGVNNNLSLAAYANALYINPGTYGVGGGGDEGMTVTLRSRFEDTAFWEPSLLTDTNGTASVSLTLPDNLTTWVATLRGLTADTKVGEATVEVVTTKELLLRPVTPRFFVSGDHVELGAVVHNYSGQALTVEVTLQASGASLDEPALATQTVEISASGSERVNWWVRVGSDESVDLLFKAEGGGLVDETTPQQGSIPVLRYAASQTVATSGVLTAEGQSLEVIALPRSFTPTGGELRLELSSSLGSAILDSLQASESYPTEMMEVIASRLQMNLTAFDYLRSVNSNDTNRIDTLAQNIRDDVDRLERLQNYDGGWGWTAGAESDAFLSAYIVYAFLHAQNVGFFVDSTLFESAKTYLYANLRLPVLLSLPWDFDRLVFQHFVLQETGAANLPTLEFYTYRDQLSPWGKALLAYTLEMQSPGSSESASLVSDVQGSVLVSATSAHWEDTTGVWVNYASPVYVTAVIIYILTQIEPDAANLDDAVRYLIASQQTGGGFSSSYENAWVAMALYAYTINAGELQGDFNYRASLNQTILSEGSAGQIRLLPLTIEVPLENILADAPNALELVRNDGGGNLYYRSYLQVFQPVEGIGAVQRGLSITRRYERGEEDCGETPCEGVHEVSLSEMNAPLRVRLTITVPESVYYLVVEDTIPAGMEIVNEMLNTTQMGGEAESQFDFLTALDAGWNWWLFTEPQIYADQIRWVGQYIPAGTYELTYRLQPLQRGEYQVIPAHTYLYYFPEVEGSSVGELFTILP